MYRVSLDTEVSERSNVIFAKDPHEQSNKVGQTISDVMLINLIRKDHANAWLSGHRPSVKYSKK